jgi:hypothetical protein
MCIGKTCILYLNIDLGYKYLSQLINKLYDEVLCILLYINFTLKISVNKYLIPLTNIHAELFRRKSTKPTMYFKMH